MTIRDSAIEYLYEHGMFEQDANEVMDRVEADEANEAMKGRWNDDVRDYPTVLQAVLFLSVRRVALEWIDENCPQAWYRAMFEEEVPA